MISRIASSVEIRRKHFRWEKHKLRQGDKSTQAIWGLSEFQKIKCESYVGIC